VAAPTIVSGATSGFDTANHTTSTVLLPATSFADGDTVVIAIASDATSQTFTAPTGFSTLYSNVDIPTTTPTATFALFYKTNIVKASETFDGTNYDFSVGLGTTERQAWWCWAVNGWGGIGNQGTNTSGSSATATIPAITTAQDNSLIIGVIATDQVSTPHGTATGYTKLGEVSGTSAASVSVHYQTVATAGTIATQNVTITSEQWLGVVFEIKGTGVSGTASDTLGALSLSSAGAVAIQGTASDTLDTLALSGAGNVPVIGTGADTLGVLAVDGAAVTSRSGTASDTLDVLTVAAAGNVGGGINGTASDTLGTLSVSAAGAVAIKGTAADTFDALSVNGAGTVAIKGTASNTLGALSVDATGNALAPIVPPTIRGWSKGADTGNTFNTNVILPTWIDGDTLYVAIVSDAGSQNFTAPSGFATLYSDVAVSGSTATMAVFYRTNSLHADFDFDSVNYSCSVGVALSERQSYIAFSVESDGGIESQNTNATGSSNQAHANSITTLSSGDLVIAIIATDGTTLSHTDAASGAEYTKLDEEAGVSAGSISTWYASVAPAATLSQLNINLGISEQWVGVNFVIRSTLSAHADIMLGALSVAATAITSISGTANITLDALSTSSSGTVPRAGSAAIMLDALAVNSYPARIGSGTDTLGALTVDGVGIGLPVIGGTGSDTLGVLGVSAAGTIAPDLPAATLRGYSSGFDTHNGTATNIILPDMVDGDTLYVALVSDQNGQTFIAPTPDFSPVPFATLYNNVAIPPSAATFALFYRQNIRLSDFAFDGTHYNLSVSVVIPERQSYIAWTVTSDGGVDEQGANVTGSGSAATIPGLTPNKNNSLLFGIVATDSVTTPHTGATGYTKVIDVGGSSAGSLSLWSHVLPTAAPYADNTVTLNTSNNWLGVSFSIPPTLPGTVNVTFDALGLSAAGTVAIKGAAAVTLGSLATTSSGVIPVTGSGSVTLGTLVINSQAPRTGTANITLGGLAVSASGIVLGGHVGNANIMLGALTSSAGGSVTAFTLPTNTVGALNIAPPQMATRFEISIENANGVKLGGGPLITGIRWSYRQKLSQAGEWSLEVPLAEPRTTFATLKRRVHCYVRRNGRLVWLGGGIIESREYGLSGDNVPVLTLSGPDLLRELAGVTVAFEVNALDITPRANLILADIFEAVPNWLYQLPVSLPEITARFVHESVLNALVATCEKTGAFFWMQPNTPATAINQPPPPLAFVFTGESNAGGLGLNSDATTAEVAPRSSVQILNLSTFQFENLDIGTNNLRDHAGMEAYYDTSHGFELQLANSVEAGDFAQQSKVYLIKTGQGLSKVADWNIGGTYWTKFRERIGAARLHLPANRQWIVFYSLGINDGIAGTDITTFKADTIAHISKIKAELTGCFIIMTQFQSLSGGFAAINNALAEVAATQSNVFVVDSTGATTGVDAYHWGYAGLKTITKRMVTLSDNEIKVMYSGKTAVSGPRSIVVATQPVASNIIATNLANPLAAERNPNICLISDITKTETSWDAYNRLIVYGAGDGQARLTLAAATQWPNGSSTFYTYIFTDPYGRKHEFLLDKTTNTITDTLAVAEYGTIEQAAAFKEIAPITPNDADMIAAANTLVVAAVNQLVLSSFPTQSYKLTVAALRAVVHPGMQIRVQARKVRDGITYINIDDRLIIQEVDYEIDDTGEKVTGLTVATTWKPEKTGATILSEQIQKLTALEAHPQIGANENTISYREDVDDDYGAAFPFWLSRGTQQINSVTLRYKLEPLRSSVKTIGGTASGSVNVPSHSHTLSAHHHDVPHQHYIVADPGSGGGTVQIFGGGGSPDFGSLVGNGIAHQIRVSTNTDSTVSSDGNSTITVGGGATGGVTVDISSALSAVYGVFVDTNAPYAVADLAWAVNGAPLVTTPTPLGSGWYEVDVTNALVNVGTGRPLAYDNNIAVTVKPTNHAGKKVRVTAQVELRTTIQSLAVV
jgi:carbohydrate esterase-like sialic acid-specific acetylesterase